MNSEEKKQLKSFKELKVKPGTPDDLKLAIQTFIQQAVIVGEYELDTMPTEYTENLLRTMSKYPEYNLLTLELIDIVNQNK